MTITIKAPPDGRQWTERVQRDLFIADLYKDGRQIDDIAQIVDATPEEISAVLEWARQKGLLKIANRFQRGGGRPALNRKFTRKKRKYEKP